VNDPPDLEAIDNQSMEEDGILSFALISYDIDGDVPTYSASSDEPNVSADVDGNELTLTPVPDWSGIANITVTADDGSGGTDDETFELMVNAVNDAPLMVAIENQTTLEDQSILITLNATDIDNESSDLSFYASTDDTDIVTVFVEGSVLTLTPIEDATGTAVIEVWASDDQAESEHITFTLTVTAQNDAPELAAIGVQSTNEDTPLDITLSATDVDEDVLTYTASSDEENVTAAIDGTTLTLTPADNWSGTANITVTVDDGNDGGTDDETFELMVNAVNDAPELTAIGNQSMEEDGVLSFALSSSDIDGGAPTYSASSDEPNVSADVDGNELTLTPVPDWNGTANITVTVDDGNDGGTDDETFVLTVTAQNDAPELAAIGVQSTNEDTPLDITLSATDVDEDVLTYTASSDEENVTAAVNGTTLTLTPADNWSGTANITVTVSDLFLTDEDSFALTVTPVNDVPTAPTLSTPEDDSVIMINNTNSSDSTIFTWEASIDVDNDPVTYTAFIEITGIDFEDEEGIIDTSLTLNHAVIIQISEVLNLDEITLTWYVGATDGIITELVYSDSFTVIFDLSNLAISNESIIPEIFALRQNYPNPFNPVTTIAYDVPEMTSVRVDIYNILGQQVRTLINRSHEPGYYRIQWDGTNDYGEVLPSGMYIYSIQALGFTSVKKLVLMK
jgi:hypothetical protein